MTSPDRDWCACDAVLADGGTVHIRPITPDDGPALVAFHERLSDQSVYLRFFTFHPHLTSAEVERFTNVDRVDRMALIATLRNQIVAVARYDRTVDDREAAEVAFVVDDRHQGRGLGTLLLEHLAAYARTRGIRRFFADTLPQNLAMQGVFRNTGFDEDARFDDGVIRVRLEIEPTEATLDAIEARWATAAARSVERLLRPTSIAVIGCGRERGGIGHELLRNIVASEYQGPVYPVHPSARSIASIPAYPKLSAVPDEVDLAIIAVPAVQVAGVIDECAAEGVKGVVIISSGFAELGADHAAAQEAIVAVSRGAGMRVIGPNCMGIINTAPDISLNATFAPVSPDMGRVAFSSQSGALGMAALEEARRRQVGLSSFVSVGNKADISGNDLLQYWEQDPSTSVILLYLESFGNPRRFARVARRVSRSKPVIAIKSGRTSSGRRASSSHTAAAPSPDVAVDALFHQTGVIRASTLEEMFDVAQILATQPVPRGRRIAIVSNAGGPAIIAADACESAGLAVPELATATQQRLRTLLPPEAAVRNPVDLGASATAADYEKALQTVLADDSVDAVIALFAPSFVARSEDVALAMAGAVPSAISKPLVVSFLGISRRPSGLSEVVPSFAFPEPAVRALARACDYGEWRAKDQGVLVDLPGLRPYDGQAVVQRALARGAGGDRLEAAEVAELLAAYRIPVPDAATQGTRGVETVVGIVHDPAFGPLLRFGTGGSVGELFQDQAFRILPLTDADAAELVRSVRGAPLLFGHGGSRPADVAALEDLLLRVARMAEDIPELVAMDLDPVVVTPDGLVVVDAKAQVTAAPLVPDPTIRRLR
jgi:acetyl coenzyme A synthetase (ADP forming)-like protein